MHPSISFVTISMFNASSQTVVDFNTEIIERSNYRDEREKVKA